MGYICIFIYVGWFFSIVRRFRHWRKIFHYQLFLTVGHQKCCPRSLRQNSFYYLIAFPSSLFWQSHAPTPIGCLTRPFSRQAQTVPLFLHHEATYVCCKVDKAWGAYINNDWRNYSRGIWSLEDSSRLSFLRDQRRIGVGWLQDEMHYFLADAFGIA